MKLAGEHIFLRPLEEADVTDDYLEWMRDPQVTQYLECRGQTHTRDSLLTFVRAKNASGRDHLFGIFGAADGKHIGNIKIGSIREPHRSADLGLIIGRRSAWGKGYGTEAIVLATRYALQDLRLNKLWAGTYAENLGAYHAFMKAGYREVGRFHRHVLINGYYMDTILVEKCRDESDPI